MVSFWFVCLFVCFTKREKESVKLDGWGSGRGQGGETVFTFSIKLDLQIFRKSLNKNIQAVLSAFPEHFGWEASS